MYLELRVALHQHCCCRFEARQCQLSCTGAAAAEAGTRASGEVEFDAAAATDHHLVSNMTSYTLICQPSFKVKSLKMH